MAKTHYTQITHSHTYWHVYLMHGDELVNGIDWLVATPNDADGKPLPNSHFVAKGLIIENGMLPTLYTNEDTAVTSDQVQLLPGYHLSAEVVEWEGDGSVARFF